MNILSNSLQSKTATLGKSKNIIESVIKTFETSRTDEEFHNVWKKIVNFADENNINLQIPTMGNYICILNNVYFKSNSIYISV